jgi:hypothetical protein
VEDVNVGDKVRYRGLNEYEIVAMTDDGRPIIDEVLPHNLLAHRPEIVDETRLTRLRDTP